MRPIPFARILALAVVLAACSRSEAPPAPPNTPATVPGVESTWTTHTLAVSGATPKTPATVPGVESAPPPGPSAAAAAKAGAARVASVALGSALDPAKRVVAPKSSFAPTDTIYASVATEGWAAPVTLTARWTFEDGQLVNESSQTTEPGPGTTEFHIGKPSGWPAGSYQVEILADGASTAVQRFEVR
jgi:hypothetical protein